MTSCHVVQSCIANWARDRAFTPNRQRRISLCTHTWSIYRQSKQTAGQRLNPNRKRVFNRQQLNRFNKNEWDTERRKDVYSLQLFTSRFRFLDLALALPSFFSLASDFWAVFFLNLNIWLCLSLSATTCFSISLVSFRNLLILVMHLSLNLWAHSFPGINLFWAPLNRLSSFSDITCFLIPRVFFSLCTCMHWMLWSITPISFGLTWVLLFKSLPTEAGLVSLPIFCNVFSCLLMSSHWRRPSSYTFWGNPFGFLLVCAGSYRMQAVSPRS